MILIIHLDSVNIKKGSHHLMKITLDKSSFYLGETIQVNFDFTNSTIKCFQIGSYLETEEEIIIENANKKFTRIVSEFHESTSSILSTSVNFNIPIDKSTQNFQSDLGKSIIFYINIHIYSHTFFKSFSKT